MLLILMALEKVPKVKNFPILLFSEETTQELTRQVGNQSIGSNQLDISPILHLGSYQYDE